MIIMSCTICVLLQIKICARILFWGLTMYLNA